MAFSFPRPQSDGSAASSAASTSASASRLMSPELARLIPPRLLKRHPELLQEANSDELLRYILQFNRRKVDDPRLLICPLFGCDVHRTATSCPSHCTNASCPTRGKHQDRLAWLQHNMRVVHSLLPLHPPPLLHGPRLLLITTTYPHVEQLVRLEHLTLVLSGEPNVLWLVVEDASAPSPAVAQLLKSRATTPFVHLAHGPTRKGGNAQRNVALKHIRDRALSGVVYNLDDDNGYHPRLWNELRRVGSGRVGVLGVRRGVFPPPRCDGRFLPLIGRERRVLKIERPVYENITGRFSAFDAGWCKSRSWMVRRYGPRRFCVDMGGFAFDASLLRGVQGEPWEYTGHGGESELIARLLGPSAHGGHLQPLGNCARDVLVFHNEFRIVPVAMVEPPAVCDDQGQGAP